MAVGCPEEMHFGSDYPLLLQTRCLFGHTHLRATIGVGLLEKFAKPHSLYLEFCPITILLLHSWKRLHAKDHICEAPSVYPSVRIPFYFYPSSHHSLIISLHSAGF